MRQHMYTWKDSVGQYNLVALAVIDTPASPYRCTRLRNRSRRRFVPTLRLYHMLAEDLLR